MHMHAEQRKAVMPDNLDRSILRPGRTLVTTMATYVFLLRPYCQLARGNDVSSEYQKHIGGHCGD